MWAELKKTAPNHWCSVIAGLCCTYDSTGINQVSQYMLDTINKLEMPNQSYLKRMMYLLIGVGPLCLCSRASLGGTVRAILLCLTLLILRILG